MRNLIGGMLIGLIFGVVIAVTYPSHNDRQPHIQDTNNTALKQTWRLVSLFPSSMHPRGPTTTQLVQKVNVLTKGVIELQLFEPGTLFPELEIFDAVSNGTIEAALTNPSFWGSKSRSFELLGGFPFGPKIEEFLGWYQIGGGRELSESLYRRYNIHGIVCGVTGPMMGGWFRKPVQKLTDLQDKLVASVGLAARVLSRAGARTTLLAPQDIAPALKSGKLFGATIAAPYGNEGSELSKSAGYVYFPGWNQQFSIVDLMINLRDWKNLDSDTRDRIEIACAANIADSLAQSEGRQFRALKSLIKHGIEVLRWSPQLVSNLEIIWQNEVSRLNAKNKDFRRIWNSMEKFSEDYSIWQELGYL